MHGDLVLLHGFTQTGRAWDQVVAAVGERYYHCHRPDLPGHGSFAGRRPATFDAVAAHVAVLAPGPFGLVGYSMGGRLALATALRLGARVTRLTLIGASPGLAGPAEREERRAADLALARRIETDGLEAFVDAWGAQPLFAGQSRGVAARARADRLRGTAAGYAAALRGMGTGGMEPLWDRLGELTMPVTLIVGERDAKFRAIAERMAPLIPDARVATVAGAGHAVALEQPHRVADLL